MKIAMVKRTRRSRRKEANVCVSLFKMEWESFKGREGNVIVM